MKTSVLKPGLLVSLSVRVRGGVLYQRKDLEAEHVDESGAKVARWETLRNIPDPEEFDRATQARSKARGLVVGVCCPSLFGLLCPNDREKDLAAAVEEARAVAQGHNAAAMRSQIEVFVLVGRIAQDDAEAARAIGAEMRELLEDMRAGIKAADPEAIREAANKARALGGMLKPEVEGKVSEAIAEARLAARELVKRVAKAGERAADVVAVCSVRAIEAARFSFLDLDGAQPVTSEAPTARGLDLDPAAGVPPQTSAPVLPQLSLEV